MGKLTLVTPDVRIWEFNIGFREGYVAVNSENIVNGALTLPERVVILDDGRPYVGSYNDSKTPLQDVLASAARHLCSSSGRR
jgi:hypothetical protein